MRSTFVRTLCELADRDPRVVFLTGDLGYTVVEPFAERHPDRFFNVGVAEQNMVGLATGLAESGFIPFVYSIATFACLRPYEFIRNGPVLHHLPVRIVGVGGGFEYGPAGPTHHAVEDVGVMRLQPGLAVVCPADYQQAAAALRATWDLPGPVYYRLGKDERSTVPGLDGRFMLGRAEQVREGDDLVVLAMGALAGDAVAAADALREQGVSAAVVVVASLSPPPVEDLVALLSRYRLAVTAEAHYVIGGLGSLVSEVVAERALPCRVVRCGLRTALDLPGGGEQYLARAHGISCETLVQMALGELASAPT
ncbi:MAG TPA: transketolase C-terminal domain-containing protein [Chloroflexota bacterium]|nr:transketolase C-terminal domain-containing protein [Chloroflexota bacterium]